MNDTNNTAPWESFRDQSYYDLWCVRRRDQRAWGQGYHVQSQQEAESLRDLLNGMHTALHACKLECQRDELAAKIDRICELTTHGDIYWAIEEIGRLCDSTENEKRTCADSKP